MDDVEKLAEEIEEKCSIEGWKDSNGRGCDSCICSEKVARFILRREIEAKIEGYEKAKAFFIINEQNSEAFEIINLNIAELRKQLEK